ncbi:MAG: hypothetical protein ACO1OO_00715 [Flavisolibacter sp.]
MNLLKSILATRLFTTADRRVDYILGFVLVLLIIAYKINKSLLLQV